MYPFGLGEVLMVLLFLAIYVVIFAAVLRLFSIDRSLKSIDANLRDLLRCSDPSDSNPGV